MVNKKFCELLWKLLKKEVEEQKNKDTSVEAWSSFFNSYHGYIKVGFDQRTRKPFYPNESIQLMQSVQTSEYEAAFKRNEMLYAYIQYFNREPTSLAKNPIGYRSQKISFISAVEGFVDSLVNYLMPRVMFSKNPEDEFTRLFELFEADFLSGDGELECYVFLDHYHSNGHYHLRINDDTEIKGFNCHMGVPSFDRPTMVDERARFYELKNWLRTCHPQVVEPNTNFFCAIKKMKITKHNGEGFISPYEFAKKVVLSLRVIAGGSAYFQAIGLKLPYFASSHEFSDIRSFPGNEISNRVIQSTRLESPSAQVLQKFWPHADMLDYQKIHIPDLKSEMSMKRTGYFGPEGRTEVNTFNDVDRLLDIFQGIESLIASPWKAKHVTPPLDKLLGKKGEYVKHVFSKIIFPDDEPSRIKLANYIGKLWNLRNDYAHGDLIKLCTKALDRHFQNELAEDVGKLTRLFQEGIKRMVVNSALLPGAPDAFGNRDREKLLELWENKFPFDTKCSGKVYFP